MKLDEIRARHQAELDAREFARTHKCTRGEVIGCGPGLIGEAMKKFCAVDVRNEEGRLMIGISSNCHRMTPDDEETQLHDDVGVLLGEIDRLTALLSDKATT